MLRNQGQGLQSSLAQSIQQNYMAKVRRMDDVKLIHLVKKHQGLYIVSHPKYVDPQYKENLWKQIGVEMQQKAIHCRTRWNNIRDNYRKSLRRRCESNNSGRHTMYKYETELGFLLKYFQNRNSMLNSFQKDLENESLEYKLEEMLEEEPAVQVKLESCSEDEECQEVTAEMENSTEDYPSSSKTLESDVEGSAETEQEFLPGEIFSNLVEGEREMSEVESLVEKAVDAFLAGLAPTLKTFSPYYLNLAKTKIFSAVQEYELAMIVEKQIKDKKMKGKIVTNT